MATLLHFQVFFRQYKTISYINKMFNQCKELKIKKQTNFSITNSDIKVLEAESFKVSITFQSRFFADLMDGLEPVVDVGQGSIDPLILQLASLPLPHLHLQGGLKQNQKLQGIVLIFAKN